jgi:hypothetical protein
MRLEGFLSVEFSCLHVFSCLAFISSFLGWRFGEHGADISIHSPSAGGHHAWNLHWNTSTVNATLNSFGLIYFSLLSGIIVF